MDDRTWIREDTLTMQLAIPPDLRIYNRYIYNDEMVQSNWCNRMTKRWVNARTLLSIAKLYEGWTYTVEQGTYMYNSER